MQVTENLMIAPDTKCDKTKCNSLLVGILELLFTSNNNVTLIIVTSSTSGIAKLLNLTYFASMFKSVCLLQVNTTHPVCASLFLTVYFLIYIILYT